MRTVTSVAWLVNSSGIAEVTFSYTYQNASPCSFGGGVAGGEPLTTTVNVASKSFVNSGYLCHCAPYLSATDGESTIWFSRGIDAPAFHQRDKKVG